MEVVLDRRKFLRQTGGCLAALALNGPSQAEIKKDRPNVLMIAVDDMNDWVGYLGGYAGEIHTPNFDRLARRGVVFTNAHSPSTVCNPSRTAILTGLRPSTTGIYNNGQWWRPALPAPGQW